MIHEKQIRQFCAIHTANNLLQLPSGFRFEEANPDSVDMIHRWSCNGQTLQECSQRSPSDRNNWYAATHQEFDKIAQEITLRESRLMHGDPSLIDLDENDVTSLSSWQRIWSHHGTPYLGNYSLEVLQLALKRRCVSLDYFHVTETNTARNNVKTKCDSSSSLTAKSIHIGYVVYEQGRTYTSYLKQIGCYVPIVKHFCQGKHWYAITRVQYSCEISDASSPNDKYTTENDAQRENAIPLAWHLIDSKLNIIHTIDSDEQLMLSLRSIQNSGGLVFRATFFPDEEIFVCNKNK